MAHDPSDEQSVIDVARLARIAVGDDEVDGLAESFRRILDLAEQISAADTESVAPMAHPMDLAQRLRPDEPAADDRRDAFLAGAPDADDGYFLVPRVIE